MEFVNGALWILQDNGEDPDIFKMNLDGSLEGKAKFDPEGSGFSLDNVDGFDYDEELQKFILTGELDYIGADERDGYYLAEVEGLELENWDTIGTCSRSYSRANYSRANHSRPYSRANNSDTTFSSSITCNIASVWFWFSRPFGCSDLNVKKAKFFSFGYARKALFKAPFFMVISESNLPLFPRYIS